MQINSTFWKSAMVAIAACLVSAMPVHAALSGNSVIVSQAGWTGTINYAVLNTTTDAALLASLTSTGSFSGGIGSPGGNVFSAPANSYVYLYQPTNSTGSSVSLSQFTNSLGAPGNNAPISPTKWGSFGGVAFVDAQGNINSGNGLNSGGLTGFASASGLKGAVVNLGPVGFPSSIIGSYTVAGFLAAGQTSDMFVFVSPYAPATFFGSLQNGGAAITGPSPAPQPIPEPGTALLGLMGLGLVGWVRRRVAK